MGTPGGVDQNPRTKRHGCRERPAAGSGLSASPGEVCARNASLNVYQARVSLELMMKHQLELRREETRAIHEFVPSFFEGLV